MVYVGEAFASRRAIKAQHLQPGDRLITSSTETPQPIVRSVLPIRTELVNVLTLEPALELANGLVVSAHSHHETLYGCVFWPIRQLYQWMGMDTTVTVVESLTPWLEWLDQSLAQPLWEAIL